MDDFTLINAGPGYGLLRRLGIDGRGALILVLIAWVPLLLLSALEGTAVGDTVRIPFLLDFSPHVRFLFVLPLLIIAGHMADRRLRAVVHQFASAPLLDECGRERFEAIIARTLQLRDSALAAVLILVLAYVMGLPRGIYGVISSWRQTAMPGLHPSLAEWWNLLVSGPVLRFLILSWLWKYVLWCVMLRQVSKLDLKLTATHPDRTGGLLFVSWGQSAFRMLVLALSALLAAGMANLMIRVGLSIRYYVIEIVVFTALVLIIFLGPLLFFTRQLVLTKVRGVFRYGALGSRYTREFQERWIDGSEAGEPLLGTSDIQSLADIGNAYERVLAMHTVPLNMRVVVSFAAVALIPMLPFVFLVVPAEVVGQALVRVLRSIM